MSDYEDFRRYSKLQERKEKLREEMDEIDQEMMVIEGIIELE